MTTVDSLQIGQLVQVQARTWPGINQPGGVGRITGSNSSGTRVAVRYVLDGRREKEIDTAYVCVYEDEASRLRDRSVMLGRCRRCGSLRSDCGSCDLRKQEQEQAVLWQRHASHQAAMNLPSDNEGASSSSSSGEDSIAEVLNNVRKLENQSRKFKRLLRRSRRFLDDDSSSDDEQAIKPNPDMQTPNSQVSGDFADDDSTASCTPHQLSNSSNFGSPNLFPPNNDGSVEGTDINSDSDDSLILQALAQRRRRNQKRNRSVQYSLSENEDELSADSKIENDNILFGIRNESSEIPYEKLPEYCDGIVGRLEDEQLPAARRQLVQFERESATPSEALASSLMKTYQEWVEQLVRQGTDQCQTAMRKITRHYRSHKESIPASRRQEFRGTGMEVRETRVDNLSRAVEEVMSRLWQLSRKVRGLEKLDSDEEVDEDDGWVDPSRFESPERPLSQSPAHESQTMLVDDTPDPHPYASRKRRQPATHIGRFRRYRKQKQRTKGYRSRTMSDATQRAARRDNVDTIIDLDQDDLRAQRTENRRTHESALGTGRTNKRRRRMRGNEAQLGTETSHAERRSSDAKSSPTSGLDKSSLRTFFAAPASMSTRAAPDQERAVDRMQSFLRANGIEDDDQVDFTGDSIFKGRSRASHSNQPRRHDIARNSDARQSVLTRRTETTRRVSYENGDVSRQTQTHSSWFDGVRSLVHKPASERTGPDSNLPSSSEMDEYDINELCRVLETEYDSSAGEQSLRKLSQLCASDGFGTFADARKVLNTLWKSLRENGTSTFQHFIALHNMKDLSRLLLLHISVLNGMAVAKDSDPSMVTAITGPISLSDYVDFVILQFTESFLSLLLPDTWKLQIDKPDPLIQKLDPLRLSLGRHCNLLESTALCLVKRLPAQQWRLGLDNADAYVSCIEPVWWSDFLRSGKFDAPQDVASLRYGDLKVKLPRSESDAIWALLGFVGLERIKIDAQAPCTRRLISFLFSSGSMVMSENQHCLPPSPAQISACVQELQNVSSLLWTKALDSVTMKDSVLANLIKQAIALGSEHVGGIEDARIQLFPVYKRESNDWRKLKAFQKRFGLASFPDNAEHIRLQNAFDMISTSHTFLGQDEYLPSTMTVRRSLQLLIAWHNVLPCKRLRYINFEKAKNNIVAYLTSMAKNNSTPPQDAFQQAFSTTTPAQSGQADKRRRIVLLEAAAYLEVVHAIVLGSNGQLPAGVVKMDSSNLIKRVWGLLTATSDEPVDVGVDSLLGTLEACPFSQDPYFLCVCARTVVCAGLLCDQFLPSATEEKDLIMSSCPLLTVTDLGAMRNFTFGCLVDCFHMALALTSSVEATCFVLKRLLVYIDQVQKAVADEGFAWVDPLLLQKLDKTGTACISGIIASSYCGSEEDICLSLALMVADFVSLSKNHEATKMRQTDSVQHDMWGGLDDSLFASIDVGNGFNKRTEDSCDLVLAKALREAIPSVRFVNQPQNNRSCTSVQGRMLVGRRLGRIAQSIVLRWHASRPIEVSISLSTFFNLSYRVVTSEEDFDDLKFCNETSSALLDAFCLRWQTHGISIQEGLVPSCNIVLKTVEQLLDSVTVSDLPSKVLAASAIEGSHTSDTASSQELVLYENFRQGGLRTTKKKNRRMWTVCRELASMRLNEDKHGIVDCFNRTAAELLSDDALLVSSSMEQELCHRLKFLHRLLLHAHSVQHFEILVSTTLGIVSTEILRLMYRIGSARNSAEHPTKLLHVLNGYILLHGWILAVTLSQDKYEGKVSDRLRHHVVRNCLIPLLLQEKKAVDIVAGNIIFAKCSGSHASSNHRFPKNLWTESFYSTHRDMIALCTCWFVRQAANGNQELSFGLLNSLLTSATDRESASTVIGSLFGAKLPEAICTYADPDLQNTFVSMVSLDFRTDRLTESQVSQWMCHVLEDCFAQRLKRSYLKPAERTRWLYLLEYLLRYCQKGKLHKLSVFLNPFTLACVGHSLMSSLKTAITRNVVDGSLLEVLLVCLSILFGMPSNIVASNGFGWIADWCSDSDVLSDEDNCTAKSRSYLHRVMVLSTCICNSLIDTSNPGSTVFHEYRRRLMEAERDFWKPLGEMNESLIESIQLLETELGFATNMPSRPLVNNVYAAREEQGGVVLFLPDEKARAAAMRFLSEVRRTT